MAVVGPLMERASAELVGRYEVADSIAGSDPPQYVSIIDYPDDESVRQVFDDPSYQALGSARDAAFDRYEIVILK